MDRTVSAKQRALFLTATVLAVLAAVLLTVLALPVKKRRYPVETDNSIK